MPPHNLYVDCMCWENSSGSYPCIKLTLSDEQLAALRQKLPSATTTETRNSIIDEATTAALREEIRARLEAEVARDVAKADLEIERARYDQANVDRYKLARHILALWFVVRPQGNDRLVPATLDFSVAHYLEQVLERLRKERAPAPDIDRVPTEAVEISESILNSWRMELGLK